MSCVCFFAVSVSFSVNYRGSIGYGQDSIYSLPGNVGTQDVKDVQVRINQTEMKEQHVLSEILLFSGYKIHFIFNKSM